MKRRFANKVNGEYIQKRIDEDYFTGYACYVKIQDVKNPLIVPNGDKNICIIDENYEWLELYPDNGHYALTIMYDDNSNLIEWYFDISKEIGLENGIPNEDDLYLDLVVEPDGTKRILDEEELLNALNNKEITESDCKLAYQTLKMLEEKYVNNFNELIELTNNITDLFAKSNLKLR